MDKTGTPDPEDGKTPITPYKTRRPVRIERTLADRLDALETHVRLLRSYARLAFQEGDSDYFGEVAAKLRLLVGEHGNKPLLLDLIDEMGQVVDVTLGGPPIQPPPGRPGPGDQITLREYLHLEAIFLRVPSRGMVSITKAQLIEAWAQQVGGAHEDRAIDEELAYALFGGIYIGGLPASAAELNVATNTVLHVADRFLAAVREHS
ncbi:MAG: hypothetical protein ABSC51_10850 [Gaiellaceae bacterium]|jgi:hypothetical protein